MKKQSRVRDSDRAVRVEGIGYVTELQSFGGKKAAGEAARKAIES